MVSPSPTGSQTLSATTPAPGPERGAGRGGERLFGRLRRFLGGEEPADDDRDD
jgi:hypothetical protein